MDRVLVTGHRGAVGGPVAAFLRRLGYDVAGFDRAEEADVLDLAAVRRAAAGCAAIVHLAALAHDTAGTAPSLELAARLAPRVPVTNPARYQADPWAALVDCSAAATTLGWHAGRRWSPDDR